VKWSATEALLHRALAAADLAVVFDPHGATATPVRAAMRYGAVPVAQRTPAMDEAVVDLEPSMATGTGFLFVEAADLFGALQRGVSAHRGRGWRALQRRVMRLEGGWERAARRLAHLIQQIEG
jgi:starch synthase